MNDMAKPLVSIIVPVYNVAPWLKRCLDSIAGQSYRNLEIILVDDGSTDGSGKICDAYCMGDPRFRVIHQENRWLSGARNSGLEAMSGDYVCFIDSDDRVHPEYVSKLYEGIAAGYDLSMVGYNAVDEDLEPLPLTHRDIGSSAVFSRDECLTGLITGMGRGPIVFGVVWNKMYPASLVKDIRFGNDYSMEDAPFNLQIYRKIQKAILAEDKLYDYVQRSGSILHGDLSKIGFHRLSILKKMVDSLPMEESKTRDLLLERIFSTQVLRYRDATRGTEYQGPMQDLFKSVRKELWREYRNVPDVPSKTKSFFALCWSSPAFWEFYRNHILKDVRNGS